MFRLVVQKVFTAIVDNLFWIALTTALQFTWWAFTRKTPMLEGKELEGKIGENGSYELDVTDKGHVNAAVKFGIQKELIPGADVKLNVEGSFDLRIATLVGAQAAKSDNKVLKYLAALLKELDSGQEPPAAIVAMAEAHPVNQAQA